MAINFNSEPYYDDFDESKGFYRILFRPGYAVQARELTQLQTNIQKQLSRFGEHIFREGSIVLGGAFDVETDIGYVKIASFDTTNVLGAGPQYFTNKVVVGTSNGIKAYVKSVEYDTESQQYVLFVRYITSSPTSSETAFVSGEVLQLEDNTNVTATATLSPSGLASSFTINSGVLFTKGYFVVFDKQSVAIDLYSSTPTATVGFKITETLVTAEEDETLLDNAQGTYNYAAPGADRLRVEASLIVLEYGDGGTDPDFTPLFSIKDGVIEESNERSQYARVYEEIAKRTFDESGDYYVNGFGVRTRDHLDTGTNEGLYTAENGGDPTKISIDVEPGLAYVKGYEVNHLVTKHLITDKSDTVNYVNNQFVTARTGNYIVIKEVVGNIPMDKGTQVTLYNQSELRVSGRIRSSVSPAGAPIGTARVKSIIYDSGTLGTPDGRLRVYLYDIQMNEGEVFSSSRALYINSTYDFFADIVLTGSSVALRDTFDGDLLFPIGSQFTKSIKSETGGSDTTFIYHKTENKNINLDAGGGSFTITLTGGEVFPYNPGTLSTEEKQQIIISVEGDQKFQLSGTVSGSTGMNTLTGSSTFFERLNVGDLISLGGSGSSLGQLHRVVSISSNTSMTVSPNLTTNYSGAEIARAFITGDLIDLTVKGSSGTAREVTVNSSTSMKVDLKEDISDGDVSGTLTCTVTYRASKSSAVEIGKVLFANRYVKIDCSSLSSLVDPINLGFSDVFRIKEIRKKDSAFTSATEGVDVTDSFVLDNGQQDNFYDHAKIKPLITLQESDHLLVKLDFFKPDYSSGAGYFSVDSYPVDDTQESDTTIFTYQIPTYVSSTGSVYNLRDTLDFRPVKQNTASEAGTTVGAASTNPAPTDTFLQENIGFLTAVPNSNITIDYSYYLARRDVVTLDKDGQFAIVQGTPAVFPVTPKTSENVMEIARVYIPPFPSISETLGRVLGGGVDTCISERVANIRYTMKDIGTLKQRIENLEYYNALTLLEKSAIDLSILDENGLDRFKNGFFVDGFLDHSLGATSNPDYQIAVDKDEQVIRPKFRMDSFAYKLNSSSGVQQTGSILTLPYTEEVLIDQPKATTIRNIEQSVFRFVGNLRMTPETDVWADETVVDKTIEFGNDLPTGTTMTTEWGSWEKHITGYNVYYRQAGDRTASTKKLQVKGTFTSYADAVKAANRSTRTKLETVTTEVRSGIKTTVTTNTETQNLGNLVTDVSLVPYIRPQIITLYATGIKPNTRVYVYFDGENMSEYLTPMVIPEEGVTAADTFLAEGSNWVADEFGEVLGILRLPDEGKRFRIGTKEVLITDSPTNAVDATTYAKSFFVAYGLNVQKQNTILSTKTAVTLPEVVTQSRKSTKVDIYGPSCMAYTFKVDVPPGEEGVFLTSVDVYIAALHPTLGVWFEIREMNSGGGITRTQVPYSEVWMKRDDPRLVITNDGSTPTRVNFESPVFLYNDTQYAFVIHTEGLNPDTYFWVSRLGETDIASGLPVTSRQLTGTLFTTNNNLNYDMVPDVDLKVKFNRAKFTPGTGTINLGNASYEFIQVDLPNEPYNLFGEKIFGSASVTLSSLSGSDTIAEGDIINGVTSGASGEIIDISGTTYFTNGIGFVQGESFTIDGKDKIGTLATVNAGEGTLVKYDSTTTRMTLKDSNGKFFVGGAVKGQLSETETTISGFGDYKYSVMNFKPNFLNFNNTSVKFTKRGWRTSTSSLGSFTDATPDSSSAFESEKAILSRVTEIASLGGNTSAQVEATVQTSSEYVSPVLDLTRSHSVYIYNIINTSVVDELEARGGQLMNKYISKTVTLADGQDAEDMLVTLSAYRPPGSEIYVWIKLKSGEDGQAFDDKPWIAMVPRNSPFSSIANSYNFVELNYDIDPSYMNNGVVEYTHEGNLYSGFKQFAIKIGLAGTNSAVVPRVGDLRAIALQK